MRGGLSVVITRIVEPEETVVRTMSQRAFIFTCCYKTAWEQYMTKEEKHNLSFEHVYDYLIHS